MLKDLPEINMHFHAHAVCYRGGDIVFLIDGSEKMRDAYDGNGIREALECADVVRNKLNCRTRVFYYGTDKGLQEVGMDGADMMTRALKLAHGTQECSIETAMRDLAKAYPDTSAHRPLHVIVVSGGDNTDKRFGNATRAVRDLLEKPGVHVMLDVVLAAKPYQNFMRLMGPAMSHMLAGDGCKTTGKPEPMVYTAFDCGQMGCAISDAINKRIEPENPHRFMVDVICDVFRQGSPPDMQCPPRAIFKKKPR